MKFTFQVFSYVPVRIVSRFRERVHVGCLVPSRDHPPPLTLNVAISFLAMETMVDRALLMPTGDFQQQQDQELIFQTHDSDIASLEKTQDEEEDYEDDVSPMTRSESSSSASNETHNSSSNCYGSSNVSVPRQGEKIQNLSENEKIEEFLSQSAHTRSTMDSAADSNGNSIITTPTPTTTVTTAAPPERLRRLDRETSITFHDDDEYVERVRQLMREQDAELLESIHFASVNQDDDDDEDDVRIREASQQQTRETSQPQPSTAVFSSTSPSKSTCRKRPSQHPQNHLNSCSRTMEQCHSEAEEEEAVISSSVPTSAMTEPIEESRDEARFPAWNLACPATDGSEEGILAYTTHGSKDDDEDGDRGENQNRTSTTSTTSPSFHESDMEMGNRRQVLSGQVWESSSVTTINPDLTLSTSVPEDCNETESALPRSTFEGSATIVDRASVSVPLHNTADVDADAAASTGCTPQLKHAHYLSRLQGSHIASSLPVHDNENQKDDDSVERSEKLQTRRLSEAMQFAEVVGDVPLAQREELRIVDDDVDQEEDDDDDDGTEIIHVKRGADGCSTASIQRRQATVIATGVSSTSTPTTDAALPVDSHCFKTKTTASTDMKEKVIGHPQHREHDSSEGKEVTELESSSGCLVVVPTAASGINAPGNAHVELNIAAEGPLGPIKLVRTKTRPQWPFSFHAPNHLSAQPNTASNKRDGYLFDKLPDNGKSQDFVYKGIHSNPPDIVSSGSARGNYALLHRKAWLEVSDKYHRYGKNLRLYYRYWERLGYPTNMFFDWLDSKGEAAGQPLPELEECPRSQLDSDTVLYITNPEITQGYALRFVVEGGATTGRARVLDVDGDPVQTGPDGWIFVLRDNVMYGAPKVTSVTGLAKQRFHHSSFFGGKAVAAAGILITNEDGILTQLYPHSGHYRPGEAHMQRVLFFLHNEGVDLRTFEMDTQQIWHVTRDKKDSGKRECRKKDGDHNDGSKEDGKVEKKKKVESLHLMPAVLVACYLAHKARFIGEGIFSQIQRIRKADVTNVTEALELIDDGGVW